MPKTRFVALMLAAVPLPALAADRPALNAAISHADLDLATKAGRAALDDRIRVRADKACRRELRGSAWTPLELRACATDTIARARIGAARAIARAEKMAPPARVAVAR